MKLPAGLVNVRPCLPLVIVALMTLSFVSSADYCFAKIRPDELPKQRQSVVTPADRRGTQEASEHDAVGKALPLWSSLPFVGILLSIALIPMLAPTFWHRHYPKVSFFWALLFAIPFLIHYRGEAIYQLLHVILADYVPFLILLWGLFTVSGGIYLKGTLVGKPFVNLLFLIVGTFLASWMGTTGAAMLLIRPLIRANRSRRYKVHTIVFFIFCVANIGGLLTPLGDPPLFLGFLHGVPFFWTLRLLPEMLVAIVPLLVAYFVLDTILFRRESFTPEVSVTERLAINGGHNFLLILGIVGAVLMSGSLRLGEFRLLDIRFTIESALRDLLILIIIFVSLYTTRRENRQANGFTWGPIREIAYLFFGIFITISAPLLILRAGTEGAAGFLVGAITSPAQFMWSSGALSSVLDNAPTYLAFFNLALGRLAISPHDVTAILTGQLHDPAAAAFVKDLAALSVGSVFFGAMTYIGNAPNFMVRAIAEEAKVRMPNFLGYCLWSIGILIPTFILVTVIFFL